jgi:PTS system cellobiose-specific IIA component
MPNDAQSGIKEMDESVVQDSMQIILHAGDARTIACKALEIAAAGNASQARELVEKAHKELLKAHHIHTDRIQSEAAGNGQEYTLLFAHAQDTLMTITSEISLTKRLIDAFDIYNSRIDRLEAELKELQEGKEN